MNPYVRNLISALTDVNITDITNGQTLIWNSTTETFENADVGAASDLKDIKVSANDTTPGFLASKIVAGTNVTITEDNDGANETITINASVTGGGTDEKDVKVSPNDATPGFLSTKIVAGPNVTITENNDGANETLTIESVTVADDKDIKVSANDTTPGFLLSKIVGGDNVTITENNDGANETLTIDSPQPTGAEIKTAYEAEADTNAYKDADKQKVDFISVTQPVDLDSIESRVNELDAAVVLQGSFDASTGSFPAGTQAGHSYIISVAGTIDGIDFSVNDRLVSLVDGASTTVYAGNWLKLDYTDQVLSVAGKTGVVTLVEADITDFDKTLDAVLEAGNTSTRAMTVGNATIEEISYNSARGDELAVGNFGASQIIDFAVAPHVTGTLNSNTIITHANEVGGKSVTLYLQGDGTQRTITWSDVDTWLDGVSGTAPAAPTLATEVLAVTLQFIGTTCYASATGNYNITS